MSIVVACNFTEKFEKCQKLSNNSKYEISFLNDNLNLYYTFKLLQYAIEIYARPSLCLLGLITNFLTARVLYTKRKAKNFTYPMYFHMKFNVFFNILYCMLNAFLLINICIFPKNSEASFCSRIFKFYSAQFFKIYGVNWLGNALKHCSDFSFLSISVGLYIYTYLHKTIPEDSEILGHCITKNKIT